MKAIERRKTRSEVPHEALSLYLDSMARRGSLAAVALASDDGLLLAASSGDYDGEGLAAISVARERRMDMSTETIQSILRGERFSARSMDVHGERFYLAWIGQIPPSIEGTKGALHRILGPVIGASVHASGAGAPTATAPA